MDTSTIETIREIVNAGSLTILFLVAVVALVGTVKPSILRKLFKEFSERKYIMASCVFVALLSATIFTATQPTNQAYESNTQKVVAESTEPLPQDDSVEEVVQESIPAAEPQPSQPASSPPAQQTNPAPAPSSPSAPKSTPAQTPQAAAPTTIAAPKPDRKCRIISFGDICI